jgi:chromosome segregation protein
LSDLEAERQTYLNQRPLVDRQLVEARKALDEHDNEFRGYEQERHRIEHLLGQKRENLSAERLAHQGLNLRAQQLDEAIRAAGHELAAVLEALPAAADPVEWQEQLVTLEAKIRRLEPVNFGDLEYEEHPAQDLSRRAVADLNTALKRWKRHT